jgi:flagellar hook-associated protein 1
MSSLGSILSIARSALNAQQAAIQVTAHNITNAATPGYSRQRPSLTQLPPLTLPMGQLGTGVFVQDVGQVRDRFLDAAYRRESSSAEGHRLRQQVLGRVEALFGEPSPTGLAATLDAFWSSWGDLANHPSSQGARVVVQTRGEQLIAHLRMLATGIAEVENSTAGRLTGSVERVNQLGAQVASLNSQIVAAETGGKTAGDLRDARNLALDELARLGSVQVVERERGSIGVIFGNVTLVDGGAAHRLRAASSGVDEEGLGSWRVELEKRPGQPLEPGGTLEQLTGILNHDLRRLQLGLDELAREVATAVNALHGQGMALRPGADEPLEGLAFFAAINGDRPIGALNLRLADEVAAHAGNIAAGRPLPDADDPLEPIDPALRYQAGANDIALQLAAMRLAPPPDAAAGTPTFAERYANLVTGLGMRVAAAEDAATVHETLAYQAETQRASVSGVSIDEELVLLIQYQRAYSAAARIVTTADDMMRTILQM